MRIEVLATARKHGMADDDILHALRNAIFDYPNQGDHELTMAVGPARNGVTMVEVGYLSSEDGSWSSSMPCAPGGSISREGDHDAAEL